MIASTRLTRRGLPQQVDEPGSGGSTYAQVAADAHQIAELSSRAANAASSKDATNLTRLVNDNKVMQDELHADFPAVGPYERRLPRCCHHAGPTWVATSRSAGGSDLGETDVLPFPLRTRPFAPGPVQGPAPGDVCWARSPARPDCQELDAPTAGRGLAGVSRQLRATGRDRILVSSDGLGDA
jgi:hypothetical protein